MRSRFLFATAFTLAASLAAHADTISTFNLSANLDPQAGSGAQVAGTILLDTTTGVVTGSHLTALFNGVSSPVSNTVTHSGALGNGSAYDLSFGAIGADSAFLSLVIPVHTLVGFNGSTLCYELNPCSQAGSNFTSSSFAPGADVGFGLTSGSLTLVPPPLPPTVTPEPSSLALLGTGLLSSLLYNRRQDQTLPSTAVATSPTTTIWHPPCRSAGLGSRTRSRKLQSSSLRTMPASSQE